MTISSDTAAQIEGAARLAQYNVLWDIYRDAHAAARAKRLAAGDSAQSWAVYQVERDAAHALDPDYMTEFQA